MEIYQTLMELIDKPTAVRPYQKLKDLYLSRGLVHESKAFGLLIEKRFVKNANTPDHAPNNQG